MFDYSWTTKTPPDCQNVRDIEEFGLWSKIATSPPTSPEGSSGLMCHGSYCSEKAHLFGHQRKPIVPDFSNILKEEEIQTVNLRKEQLKTLGLIQVISLYYKWLINCLKNICNANSFLNSSNINILLSQNYG